jgi:hypothetical protein
MDPRIENVAPNTVPAMRSDAAMPTWPRAPRSLSAGRGAAWWSEGWRVFTAAPLLWIGMLVVLVVIMFALNFIPIIGQIAGVLLWPVWYGGLMLGCHALATGRPLAFSHLFAGFGEGRAMPLILLGLIYAVVSFVLFAIVMFIALGSLGFAGLAAMFTGDPTAMSNAMAAGMGTATIFAVLVGIVFGALFVMGWWFAPPLVALNRADALSAVSASFGASMRNLGALVVAFLIFLVLAVLASIPFGLGWLVLGPVAIGAYYASWREVFGE